jgi:hypothetical protein
MSKKLVHKVELSLFQDDTGLPTGLAHSNALERGFNPFWDGVGIFHDVFEHWFEKRHKYFQGDCAFNIGGEMAAMGAALYYSYELGVDKRILRNYGGWPSALVSTTESLMQEAVCYGYTEFGDTLECGVPYQRGGTPTLERMVQEMMDRVREYDIAPAEESNYRDEREVEAGYAYLKSIKERKIRRLHRWGYNMAERLVPMTDGNRRVLTQFITYWNDFTKQLTGEELVEMGYTEITFRIYKEKGEISWTARLVSGHIYAKDVLLRPDYAMPCLDDLYLMNEVFY